MLKKKLCTFQHDQVENDSDKELKNGLSASVWIIIILINRIILLIRMKVVEAACALIEMVLYISSSSILLRNVQGRGNTSVYLSTHVYKRWWIFFLTKLYVCI